MTLLHDLNKYDKHLCSIGKNVDNSCRKIDWYLNKYPIYNEVSKISFPLPPNWLILWLRVRSDESDNKSEIKLQFILPTINYSPKGIHFHEICVGLPFFAVGIISVLQFLHLLSGRQKQKISGRRTKKSLGSSI